MTSFVYIDSGGSVCRCIDHLESEWMRSIPSFSRAGTKFIGNNGFAGSLAAVVSNALFPCTYVFVCVCVCARACMQT